MAELLLELLSEEIPATMQARAADDLKRLVTAKIEDAMLGVTSAKAFATPRRLALVVEGIAEAQPDSQEERRGPREGAPQAALDGFLRSTGLGRDDLDLRETDRGRFYFATVKRQGGPSAPLIGAMVGDIVRNFPWPKSMRWGAGSLRWVRPLHGVLCLFAGKPVAVDLPEDIAVGARSRGHRFLAPDAFEVANYADYRAKLAAARVMLDPDDRRAAIVKDASALTKALDLEFRPDAELLAEVVGLVEWPVVLAGAIDPRFMNLPSEVLITSMKAHQRYFPLYRRDGALAPHFVVVANVAARDGGKAIIAGNERVLRARLHDAEFLWRQDRKLSLEARLPRLDGIVFQAKLGSIGDKVRRIEALAAILVAHVPGAEPPTVQRAARLCKADLVTGMVHEFPELQGLIGRYYARADGELEAVATAIWDHYAPLGPSDRCPNAPTSVAVALADKIDTLVGFWIIDEKPTGSKDPFALRRAALGVIRLIVENRLRVPLWKLFVDADQIYAGGEVAKTHPEVPLNLLEFIAERMKVALREKGVRHDLIDAVFGVGSEDDLVRLLARVEALERFLDSDDGANLLAAYRRASNIVRIEEKKDKTSYDGEPEPARLIATEEKELHRRLADSAAAIERALPAEDFAGAMAALSALRAPVDEFFDKVTVNCDEAALRANRLRLLSRVRAAIGPVADFARVEG